MDVEKRPYWEYIVAPVARDLPIPREPRYERATRLACIFILKEGIDRYPVEPFFFFTKYGIKLNTYSRVAKKKGMSDVAEIISATGSEDGLTAFRHGRVTVLYNDLNAKQGRIYFTLLHEIAHIVLGHTFDFGCTRLSRGGIDEVEILEREADCFARNVIAPVQIVTALRDRRHVDAWDMFHMTPTAWKTRFDFLRRDKYNTNPALTLMLNKQLAVYMYGCTCNRCGAGFVGHKDIRYCPICGSRDLKWRMSDLRYDDGVEVDANGRAQMCPQCGNEEIAPDGGFCKICGKIIVNRCADMDNCGDVADGNARFCTHCGCATTFFQNDLLDNWQTARAKITGENIQGANRLEDELPF